jgi:hypothetical protein
MKTKGRGFHYSTQSQIYCNGYLWEKPKERHLNMKEISNIKKSKSVISRIYV